MNRIFRSGLLLAALSIVASSCSNKSDAPIDPNQEGPRVEAPVSVALESTLLTYDAKTLEDQSSVRSLDWDPRNSEVTYTIQGSSKDILMMTARPLATRARSLSTTRILPSRITPPVIS